MSLHVPAPGGFPVYQWFVDNPSDGTQPVNAGIMGTSITPSGTANAYNTYTEIFSSSAVAYDVWFIGLHFHDAQISGTARDMIATVGIDPAGGTSYSTLIPDLLVSANCMDAERSGTIYGFPLHIPAGSSIAVKVSQNATNTTAFGVGARLWGQPAYPEMTRKGTRVEALGITAASSAGTAHTPGTTSEPTFLSLGTTVNEGNWWWQGGMGVNDSSLSQTNVAVIDFAVGSSTTPGSGNRNVVQNMFGLSSIVEGVQSFPVFYPGASTPVPAGTTVYGRAQFTGTSGMTGVSLAAYALS